MGNARLADDPTIQTAMDSARPTVNQQSAPEAKIRLFRSLFRGREDVYPRRFESRKTGKSGYAPACSNEWVRGICEKPRIKCAECPHRRFLPVTDDVIRWHLSGEDEHHQPFVAGVDPWGRLANPSTIPGGHPFFRVEGEEVHEVAVGPVHAGVIEPGHFRFQCHGEEVLHLEISLGYQHRGVERALRGGPAWVVRRPDDAVRSKPVSRDEGSGDDASVVDGAATRLTLLGTGASRGVPRVGCRCNVCLSRDQRNKRLRSSLLIEWRDPATETPCAVVVDPGMDLRQQALRVGLERLDGALITHIHVDHTGGIDELRAYTDAQEFVMEVGAAPETCAELLRRWEYAFDGRTPPGHGIPALRLVESSPRMQIRGRTFEAIPLVHGRRPAHGWRSGSVAYLTDVSSVTPSSRARLAGLDTLIVSALRDLPHPTHQTVDEALALIADLGPRRAILTHLDHDLDYHELSARLPDGVVAGFDGLVVEVSAR